MTTKARIWLAGITLVAGFGLIYVSTPTQAAAQAKDLPSAVKDIAAEIKNGKADAAKKLAAATAKNVKLIDEISDLMHMYRPSSKGGLEIENNLKKATVKNAVELGNLVNAMAELTIAKGWPENKGKRTKKAWNDFTEEMKDASIQLAKSTKPADVKTAAEKVTAACNRCHSIFKD
jgi:hypothetical protein